MVVATAGIALVDRRRGRGGHRVVRIVREQARTEQALGLAEQRRLEAEDLVSFMLVDF